MGTPVRDWIIAQLAACPEAGAYAGVGARKTPPDILLRMEWIGAYLARRGWILRSGAAEGADEAFERGAGELAQIFLPRARFRRHPSTFTAPTAEALEIAARFHPAWDRLDPFDRLLMGRNTHQVLGPDCRSPSKFLICWTPDGADGTTRLTQRSTGGTGQAIRIAAGYGMPVLNLAMAA